MANNANYQEFQTVLEQGCERAVPEMPPAIMMQVVGQAAAQGPHHTSLGLEVQPSSLGLAIPVDPRHTCHTQTKNPVYDLGAVQPRLGLKRRMLVNATGSPVAPVAARRAAGPGTAAPPVDGDAHSDLETKLTLEVALFAMLFLHAQGAFRQSAEGKLDFLTYLHMRIASLFSSFTLFKPYLLMMFQARQAYTPAKSIKDTALDSAIADYIAKHPGPNQERLAIKHVAKFKPARHAWVAPQAPAGPHMHGGQVGDGQLLPHADSRRDRRAQVARGARPGGQARDRLPRGAAGLEGGCRDSTGSVVAE